MTAEVPNTEPNHNREKLLAIAALIYDAKTTELLRAADDEALLTAALSPEFLSERHRVLKNYPKV